MKSRSLCRPSASAIIAPALALLAAAACGTPSPSSDSATDAIANDSAATDSAASDIGSDAVSDAVADAVTDAFTDGSLDVAPDEQPDVSSDVPLDVPHDAARDANADSADGSILPPGACNATDKFSLWSAGHAVLRGANMFMGRNPTGATSGFGDGDFTQADYDDLSRAGANYLQLSHAGIYSEQPPYVLDMAAQNHLDAAIRMATQAHLYVVIAYRSGPGRNENAITNRAGTLLETIWSDAAAQTGWIAMMRYTAMRYRANANVVGYDPMVEPNDFMRRGPLDPTTFYSRYAGTIDDYNVLAARVTTAIRAVDTTTPILLEPEGFGGIPWLSHLVATSDTRTVYTVHDYTPFPYAQQDTAGNRYPGSYDVTGTGRIDYVDRAYLDRYLQVVRDYASTHRVPVAVTEFGAHSNAPNVGVYLTDRTSLQDPIGNWAAWTWQPAGFRDPFSFHDPSAAHDAIRTAWAANCTVP